ncbi:hypothetical protein MLD38_007428 [Melastoma candidum]|uniref:Uncharacterized protein n=1 Tax=Melastoma candidum TaxID=119954 RepID=A0ACB9RUV6_9MYRT|nr:hypothetical protein MLD38_007428 [Melastoma candidum]
MNPIKQKKNKNPDTHPPISILFLHGGHPPRRSQEINIKPDIERGGKPSCKNNPSDRQTQGTRSKGEGGRTKRLPHNTRNNNRTKSLPQNKAKTDHYLNLSWGEARARVRATS